MKQRPIIFNTEMVQAIVDGRKTQTRRQMNPQPKPDTETSQGGYWFPCAAFQSMVHVEDFQHPFSRGMASDACPICSVGDQLYVRETFADCGSRLTYKADKDDGAHCVVKRWTPSIHMPRACARILLEVTAVRVERLNDISEQDAKAEGLQYSSVYQQWGGVEKHSSHKPHSPHWRWYKNPQHAFKSLWNSIYENWDANPWVWVIEFKVISTTGGAA
ncbi:ASCH domain-containing protein [Shewanella sp. SM95]|uniref:ASCH domain-containing protein n=1 Tax=Shewanella sp. SM95 TaxID=2912812 RepID=UPI0021DAB809|nr:ASCH domain-containing protein [Shewanella sp. SM95]MCU7998079.1 ASCH domain-containing protein [Shewanella sp. SM95]